MLTSVDVKFISIASISLEDRGLFKNRSKLFCHFLDFYTCMPYAYCSDTSKKLSCVTCFLDL